MPAAEDKRLTAGLWLLGAILTILIGAALMQLATVLIPLVLGVLVALVLAPLDHWIADHLPGALRWLARVVSLLIILAVLAVFLGGLAYAGRELMAAMPDLADRAEQFFAFEGGQGEDGDEAGGQVSLVQRILQETGSTVAQRATSAMMSLAQSATGALGAFLSILVLSIFVALLALGETRIWSRKAEETEPGEATGWSAVADAISARLRTFLWVRALTGLMTAVLYVGWLWLFDIDLLLVWGLITILLNFVPNIGSVIGGTLAALYALLTKDLQTALIIAAGLFVIEQVVGSYIDPKLQGREVSVSPLVVLSMVLVWGGIWGVAGAFLATPITITVISIFAIFAPLRPVALMLSDAPDVETLQRRLER